MRCVVQKQSRRLGVEALEGRVVLSADTTDYLLPVADTTGDPATAVSHIVDADRTSRWFHSGTSAIRFAALAAETDGADDAMASKASISLRGISAATFNRVASPFEFRIANASYLTSVPDVRISINGIAVPTEKVSLTRSRISVTDSIVEGRNDITLMTYDSKGLPIYFSSTVWAGSRTLQIRIVDDAGTASKTATTVRLGLGDDQSVFVRARKSKGVVTFGNVPDRTILVEAKASGGRYGFVGTTGAAGSVQVVLRKLDTVSPIANNDFSQGTDGWNIGSAPVQIKDGSTPSSVKGPLKRSAGADANLMLSTSGEGEQSISRTFKTTVGVDTVTIRFRFTTTEIPGGYFGSKYNDYYRVSIRKLKDGGVVSDANSMNGLGRAVFDSSGTTSWRELTMKVNPKGDVVQIDCAVANVGDGEYGSSVEIDFVSEKQASLVMSLAWNQIDGGMNLTYKVVGKVVGEPIRVGIFFARGSSYNDRIGSSVHEVTVPAGAKPGSRQTVGIPGFALTNAPAGTTHLLAASGSDDATALVDVTVRAGSSANISVVSTKTIGIIKDLLRQAGEAAAVITSTARTPEDQARAMFANLIAPGGVKAQYALYGPSGDQVVDAFVAATKDLSGKEILAQAASIQASMVDTINAVGPSKVSKHCASPQEYARTNIIDIGYSSFSATTKSRFRTVAGVDGRLALIDEPKNGCFHLSVPQ